MTSQLDNKISANQTLSTIQKYAQNLTENPQEVTKERKFNNLQF